MMSNTSLRDGLLSHMKLRMSFHSLFDMFSFAQPRAIADKGKGAEGKQGLWTILAEPVRRLDQRAPWL